MRAVSGISLPRLAYPFIYLPGLDALRCQSFRVCLRAHAVIDTLTSGARDDLLGEIPGAPRGEDFVERCGLSDPHRAARRADSQDRRCAPGCVATRWERRLGMDIPVSAWLRVWNMA